MTETRYDEVGNPVVRIDAAGQVTTYTYDVRDALFQVKESPNTWTDPASPPGGVITTEYAYDAAGNLVRMTRAKGDATNERVTDYAYDGRGLVRRETQYPSWPTTTPTLVATSTYDPNGNLAVATDQLSRTTAFSYDALNRLSAIDYSDSGTPDVGYGYDANDNRTSMTDGTGATSYTYDELDRLLSVTTPGPKVVGYRYDRDGNRTRLIYPDGSAVSYTFDTAARMTGLSDWASRSVSYSYFPDGALKDATNPNGTTATYAYDNARRLVRIVHSRSGTTIGDYDYLLDPVGNVLEVLDGVPSITRATVSTTGTDANGFSQHASINASGRYVAFDSIATNLVAGDTNALSDVFVRDMESGTTVRASVGAGGVEGVGPGGAFQASLSGDGRKVAFRTWMSNMVAGDTNGMTDIFVRDLDAATTTRVSLATDGSQPNDHSYSPAISSNGRFVVYHSLATNLVAGDTNAKIDVFIRDTQAATTARLSVASDGTQANGDSDWPVVSADGRYVVFSSDATNLVPNDTNAVDDVFVRDRTAGTTTRVSVASDGTQGNAASGAQWISADGRYVTFTSSSTNLVPGDTNGVSDTFVRDLVAGTTERVSVATDGSQANAHTLLPTINDTGRFVAFDSTASNLAASDSNGTYDVFVRDRLRGTTTWASKPVTGGQSNGASYWAFTSGDGRHVAFQSRASNLVAGDGNQEFDIFRWSGPARTAYAYDRLYRLTGVDAPEGMRTYAYDPAGNRASLTSGGATTSYSYDRADRLTQISAPPTTGSSTRAPSSTNGGWTNSANAYASDNAYATASPAKNQTQAVLLGTFGFDSLIPAGATITSVAVSVEWKVSTSASVATLGAQAWVNNAAYGSELVNSAEPVTDTTQSFSVSGLTRAQLLNGTFQVRVRASRGNSNTAFAASLDAVSVAVTYTASTSQPVTVTAVGTTTARGADAFAYDQANRLTSASVAGVNETSAYDGDGVRFSRQVGAGPLTRYITDPAAGLPVTIDDGTRKYVWGLGLAYAVSGTAIEVYHADRLGSVRALTDAAGTVTATYRADEFGIPTATTGSSSQPFRYTGEPSDASGLTYLRARFYDPSLGRFLSRDPFAGFVSSPLSLNRYSYVENNPATLVDPSGQCIDPGGPGLRYCIDRYIPAGDVFPFDGGGDNRGPDPNGGTFRTRQLIYQAADGTVITREVGG